VSKSGNQKKLLERIKIWEETDPWPCVHCGGLFKPPRKPGWPIKKYCQKPECQIAKRNRWRGMMRTHYHSRRDGKWEWKHKRYAPIRPTKELRPCLSLEKRDFQSWECRNRGGVIPYYPDHAPHWFCDDCNRQFLARDECSVEDCSMAEPINLMGGLL